MRPGVDLLRSISILETCRPSLIERLNELAQFERLGPDEVLFREGDLLDDLHILLAGHVLTACRRAEEYIPVDIISPVRPQAFATVMRGCTAPFSATTITSARVAVIPARDLRATIKPNAPIVGFLNYALTNIVEKKIEVRDLKLLTATQRLAVFLLEQIEDLEVQPVQFPLPYEKRYVAVKIGCGKENLSRSFAALRSVGVSTKAGAVVVRDISALRAYVAVSHTTAADT
jgi:CRP/FNR family transcriptional activator FtrB